MTCKPRMLPRSLCSSIGQRLGGEAYLLPPHSFPANGDKKRLIGLERMAVVRSTNLRRNGASTFLATNFDHINKVFQRSTLVACNSDIGIALMYHEACVKESFA